MFNHEGVFLERRQFFALYCDFTWCIYSVFVTQWGKVFFEFNYRAGKIWL